MPTAPPKLCAAAGCGQVVRSGRYCPACQARWRAQIEARRDKDARRLYGRKWRAASRAFLAAHPVCAIARPDRCTEIATAVDHIRPHRGDRALFWDRGNWQPTCKPCHDWKTATEEAFGRGPPRTGAGGGDGGSDL